MKIGPNRPDGALKPGAPVTADRQDPAEATDARRHLAELADGARADLLREENHRSATSARDLGGKARIAELKRRIEARYYERPEIREKIADQLADDV